MKRILVVDDEKDLTEEIEEYFVGEGYLVTVANDKLQALKALKAEKYEAIILDLRFPDVWGEDAASKENGIELLEKIKINFSISCVVVTSVLSDVENIKESVRDGAYDHIPKPFDFSVLAIVIEKGIEYQELKNKIRGRKEDECILQFAHGLIHVVKNSLWLISGSSQLLEIDNSSAESKKLIEIIQDHTDKSSKALEEIFSFEKKYKEGQKIYKEAIKVEVLINSAVTLVESFPWKNRDVEIKKEEVDLDLPEIRGDRFLLQEVLVNIIKNGVESIEAKHGEVVIAVNKGTNGFIEINVRDNGNGIYEKNSEKVKQCEPYFTTKEYGTGLGLCTSKLILEWHKGEIFVDSVFGKGTKITLKLPCC